VLQPVIVTPLLRFLCLLAILQFYQHPALIPALLALFIMTDTALGPALHAYLPTHTRLVAIRRVPFRRLCGLAAVLVRINEEGNVTGFNALVNLGVSAFAGLRPGLDAELRVHARFIGAAGADVWCIFCCGTREGGDQGRQEDEGCEELHCRWV